MDASTASDSGVSAMEPIDSPAIKGTVTTYILAASANEFTEPMNVLSQAATKLGDMTAVVHPSLTDAGRVTSDTPSNEAAVKIDDIHAPASGEGKSTGTSIALANNNSTRGYSDQGGRDVDG
jgi:hypothetical protein